MPSDLGEDVRGHAFSLQVMTSETSDIHRMQCALQAVAGLGPRRPGRAYDYERGAAWGSSTEGPR